MDRQEQEAIRAQEQRLHELNQEKTRKDEQNRRREEEKKEK